jgi:hypothetical protein
MWVHKLATLSIDKKCGCDIDRKLGNRIRFMRSMNALGTVTNKVIMGQHFFNHRLAKRQMKSKSSKSARPPIARDQVIAHG